MKHKASLKTAGGKMTPRIRPNMWGDALRAIKQSMAVAVEEIEAAMGALRGMKGTTR